MAIVLAVKPHVLLTKSINGNVIHVERHESKIINRSVNPINLKYNRQGLLKQ